MGCGMVGFEWRVFGGRAGCGWGGLMLMRGAGELVGGEG